MIDVRFVTAADVPEVIALVSDSLAEFGLEFGKGSVTDGARRRVLGGARRDRRAARHLRRLPARTADLRAPQDRRGR